MPKKAPKLFAVRMTHNTIGGDVTFLVQAMDNQDAIETLKRDSGFISEPAYTGYKFSTTPAAIELPHGHFRFRDQRPGWEACGKRWPRITRLLQWTMVASETEAAVCLRDYIRGERWGSECVSHSGLSPERRVRDALTFWRSAKGSHIIRAYLALPKEHHADQQKAA